MFIFCIITYVSRFWGIASVSATFYSCWTAMLNPFAWIIVLRLEAFDSIDPCSCHVSLWIPWQGQL